MAVLHSHFLSGVQRVMAAHRVAIHDGTRRLVPEGHPAAILAPLPDVRLVAAGPACSCRRSRLRLGEGPHRVTILAHKRAAPPEPEGGWTFVQWGVDAGRHRVPVCCVDGRSRTVHVLVDLPRARLFKMPDSGDLAMALAQPLVEQPLVELLRERERPRIGPLAARELGRFLERLGLERDRLIEDERRLFEDLAGSGAMPQALERRVERLNEVLRRSRARRAEIGPRHVERELDRLRRLLDSRACAALRFGEQGIDGLLNPRCCLSVPLAPLGFRLTVARGGGIELRVDPALNPRERGHGSVCLGDGALIFPYFSDSADVYGMLDVVLNFVESNHRAEWRLEGARNPPRLRRPWDNLFDRIGCCNPLLGRAT